MREKAIQRRAIHNRRVLLLAVTVVAMLLLAGLLVSRTEKLTKGPTTLCIRLTGAKPYEPLV